MCYLCFAFVVHLIPRLFRFFPFVEMVQALKAVIDDYKQRLMAMPLAPKPSFGRNVFRDDGGCEQTVLYVPVFGLWYSHSVPKGHRSNSQSDDVLH
jgi:hypothetical protein